MEIEFNDNFFEELIEIAKKNIEKSKKPTTEYKINMLLDYLDERYDFYKRDCPLYIPKVDQESIDICKDNQCLVDGSKNCWLYWLLKGDKDER